MTDVSALGDTGELKLTHVLNAPRDLVWTVWTDPKHAKQWYGPDGFTTPVYEADLRPGGKIAVHMQAPDGTVYPNEGHFEEVVPPERLVMSDVVSIDGVVAFQARTTVTFEADGDRTIVHVHQAYSKLTAMGRGAVSGAREGWTQQFGKLDAYLQRFQEGEAHG